MPTTTFSGLPGPRPRKRPNAWVCVAINLLAFPGMGTVMAGRRVGWIQAAIMLAGFCLAMAFMLVFIASAWQAIMTQDASHLEEQLRPHARAGGLGLILSAIAWCWSLVSSIAIIRDARKAPPPLKVI